MILRPSVDAEEAPLDLLPGVALSAYRYASAAKISPRPASTVATEWRSAGESTSMSSFQAFTSQDDTPSMSP